jgi:hypothetical protein
VADLEFVSPNDGSVLSFTVTRRSDEEADFEVAARTPFFSGVAPASTYMSGSPAVMFGEMANAWTGWKGQKKWSDLEGRVEFAASLDSTGHVSMSIRLVGQDYDSHLLVVLKFDAGQLEGMAKAISQLLGPK